MTRVRAASQDRLLGMSVRQPCRIEEVCDYNTGTVYRQRNNDRNIGKASPNPDNSLPAGIDRCCADSCGPVNGRSVRNPTFTGTLWSDRFVPLPVIPLPLA